VLPHSDEIAIDLLRGGFPALAAADLTVDQYIELPEPPEQNRTGILRQRVGGSGYDRILVGLTGGDDVIRVRELAITDPRDHGNTPLGQVSHQLRVGMKHARVV
jgi:hypothetical protein